MNRILSTKEKIFFYFLIILFASSAITWAMLFYLSKTKAIPAYGGEYIEGIVGQPTYINPLLSQSNDVDGDLSQIIYNGLLEYDGQGNLRPDLAESYDMSDDKTTYTFHLRKDVTWHDGVSFTAQDVLFTINIISDPAYKSPLRSDWQGISTDLIDDYTVEFKIESPYAGFLNNLVFGILPKHIWESVQPDNFHLTKINMEPIGTGPYKYSPATQKDSKNNILTYKLISNPTYFEGKPYISKMTFNFYEDEDSALDAYNRKEVMGISNLSSQKISSIKNIRSTNVHEFNIPRDFSVFFNQTKSVPLANDEVREALAYATDRKEIIEKVLYGSGDPVYSSFIPGTVGFSNDIDKREFDLGKANDILEQKGWKKGDDGIRAKNNVQLKINLVTTDWEELSLTAQILKSQWEKAGIRVDVNTYSISDIQQNYIRPREYEALLFGQVSGGDPDPYSFWHSSQKKDPGLNLSLFGTSDTDKLIEEGRVEFNKDKRAEIYIDFQKKLQEEIPAIFLYSPKYIYPLSKSVMGIGIETLIAPAKRFSDINHWYLKTKRIGK
jgi:peptide/nickel transport system substrate-binding protein